MLYLQLKLKRMKFHQIIELFFLVSYVRIQKFAKEIVNS